jgi:hypothetical protein
MIEDYGSEAWATARKRAQTLRREHFESIAVARDRVSDAIVEKHGAADAARVASRTNLIQFE